MSGSSGGIMVITDAGYSAIPTVGSGIALEIGSFVVGSSVIYSDGTAGLETLTSIATPVYTSTSASQIKYQIMSGNEVRYRVEMDSTVGDFTVGNIGLMTSGGILFAILALETAVYKRASAGNIAGNNFSYNFYLDFDNQATISSFTLVSENVYGLPTVSNIASLPAISTAPQNAYIVVDDGLGVPALALSGINEGQTVWSLMSLHGGFATHGGALELLSGLALTAPAITTNGVPSLGYVAPTNATFAATSSVGVDGFLTDLNLNGSGSSSLIYDDGDIIYDASATYTAGTIYYLSTLGTGNIVAAGDTYQSQFKVGTALSATEFLVEKDITNKNFFGDVDFYGNIADTAPALQIISVPSGQTSASTVKVNVPLTFNSATGENLTVGSVVSAGTLTATDYVQATNSLISTNLELLSPSGSQSVSLYTQDTGTGDSAADLVIAVGTAGAKVYPTFYNTGGLALAADAVNSGDAIRLGQGKNLFALKNGSSGVPFYTNYIYANNGSMYMGAGVGGTATPGLNLAPNVYMNTDGTSLSFNSPGIAIFNNPIQVTSGTTASQAINLGQAITALYGVASYGVPTLADANSPTLGWSLFNTHTANAPYSGYGNVLTESASGQPTPASNNWITQMAFGTTGTIYTRYNVNNAGWSTWIYLISNQSLDNGSQSASLSHIYATTGLFSNMTAFGSSSSFTVPTGATKIRVWITGGGGGGAGCTPSGSNYNGGGGGGAGGTSIGVYTVTPGTAYTVTIGAGGGGGGSNNGAGGSGGTSSFGSLATATGGAGANWGSGTNSAGGSPGDGTNYGALIFPGGFGSDGQDGGVVLSGDGGTSYWGGGGRGGDSGGKAGPVFGSGGGGCRVSTGPGGSGAAGVCVVMW